MEDLKDRMTERLFSKLVGITFLKLEDGNDT